MSRNALLGWVGLAELPLASDGPLAREEPRESPNTPESFGWTPNTRPQKESDVLGVFLPDGMVSAKDFPFGE